jgi:crotonobetainyl-CoA:carnitine CoA-transferase CaiB-like acyl-CoA transferase
MGTSADRRTNSRNLVELLNACFAETPRAVWGERADAHGPVWAPIHTLSDLVTDP